MEQSSSPPTVSEPTPSNLGRVRLPSRIVELPDPLLPETFERAIADCYTEYRSEPPELVLDFRKCTYVEIPALCCAVALAAGRASRSKLTEFMLPYDQEVLDILKVWRFFEAVGYAINKPADELIYRDLEAFRSAIKSFEGHPTGLAALSFNPTWKPGSTGQRSFFEFLSFPLSGSSRRFDQVAAAIPRKEAERWQGQLIKSVLAQHLPGSRSEENDLSRVVIFESIANAVQHPKAQLIQVASRFYQSRTATEDGSLALTIWDDGESMIETLRQAVHSGQPVRSPDFPQHFPRSWCARILIRKKDLKGVRIVTPGENDVFDQYNLPTRETTTDPEYLLACLSPGITRTYAEPVANVDGLPELSAGIAASKGMGLFTLVRTVVDRYDGTLSFRCGHYFMNLKQATDEDRRNSQVHYRATFTLFPKKFYKPFRGNLLTIRIPTVGRLD